MATGEVIDVTLQVVDVFEELGLPYLVGGSLASSLHGIPRATQDVDIVVQLSLGDVKPLVQALEATFYIDADMIKEAIRARSSCNIIHLATMFKVDLFILKDEPLARHEMARRQRFLLPGLGERSLVVASAEDIILQKLIWYRLGNQISERQWKDVLGVLKVRQGALDRDYLDQMAKANGLSDLLLEAFGQAQ